MLRKSLLAVLSLGLLTSTAPASHAGVPEHGCGGTAVSAGSVTGGTRTYTGAFFGYALFTTAGPHTLRCYVTVDGTERGTTPTVQSVHEVAVTDGVVTYTAAEGAVVAECTQIDGVTIECRDLATVLVTQG